MAIFASTTTSGYGDPLKALSIKALEQRQRDLLTQQAAEQAKAFTPENTQTPIQGLAQVANVAADRFQQSRADAALAAQKDELSKLIASGDPTNPSPQVQARMAVLAPDMYKDVLGVIAERRKQQDLFGQQDKARTEDARIAQEAAVANEARLQARPPNDDIVNIKRAEKMGLVSPEEAAARIKKLTANSPSEEKLLIEERNKAVEYQSTMQQLDKAYELISSPKGIHSGSALMTPLKTGVGSILPQSLGGPDDETQANTLQFNQIMKSQGLQDLLKMKGASSDRDVALNLELANDVKQPLERRKQALGIVRDRLYTHIQANKEDIARISGDYPKMQAAPTGSAPKATATPTATDVPRPAGKTDSELIAEAEAAKKAGKPAAAVDAQLQKWLMGK